MDSMDLEREKGITILAKNTAVRYGPDGGTRDHQHHRHPGSRRLRRRGRARPVDGRRRAAAGRRQRGAAAADPVRAPQGAAKRLPVVLVINKVDRPDARIAEVVDETYELFLDLDADRGADRVPDRLLPGQGRPGLADPPGRRRSRRTTPTSSRCSTTIVATIPAPAYDRGRAAAGARHQPRRLAVPRPAGAVPGAQRARSGKRPAGGLVPHRRHDRAGQGHRAADDRGARAGAGRGGRPGRHHRRSPASRRSRSARRWPTRTTRGRCRCITVDEPSISMTIGINTSPLAGQSGNKLTARLVKNRLDAELVGNVSIRVLPTERPDTWEVQGRGELQLAVLVEIMRREGFEITVGKPQVVTRDRRRQGPRADGAADHRRPRGLPRRGHPAARRCARAGWSRWSTTAPAGSGWSTSSRPAG